MSRWVEYKPFYLTCCSEACGDGRIDEENRISVRCLDERVTQAQLAEMVGTSAPYISRLINKKDGIVNKVFVEMLEKLGYDIQITYVKKETD